MTVSSTHPMYQKFRIRWDLVRSVVGNDAMHFIRTVDASDTKRSDQYKQDAILTNFTALTKVGLTGLVFRRKPKLTLPDTLNYMLEDATGDDLSLLQLSQKIIGEVLMTGRYGLLVDYPQVTDRISLLQDQLSGNTARLKAYAAESIINWKTQVVGSKTMLALVVLCELVDELEEDGFAWCQKKQYRVLKLNESQQYEQYLYDEDGEFLSGFMPTKANGKPFNEIPFKFIGSENNDAAIDEIPLYDLAVLNLGHYKNSADYEESIFITGQPTLFMRGTCDLTSFKEVYPSGIRFGSRAGYYLGENGGADLIQANPNQLADAAMARKEQQALSIGARLISPPGGRETAEAARIRFSSQNSALYLITTNVSLAITSLLKWASEFMSSDAEQCNFVLNDQFYDDAADPNLVIAQIQLMDRGVIAKDDLRDYARKTGMIDDERTNEDLDNEAEVVSPLIGMDTPPVQGGQ
jgi:uncharacterized protein DUF4055